jgi:hypothetical protein
MFFRRCANKIIGGSGGGLLGRRDCRDLFRNSAILGDTKSSSLGRRHQMKWFCHALLSSLTFYFAGGPNGLGVQPVVWRVSDSASIFQPAEVFNMWKESMPQWLNFPLR